MTVRILTTVEQPALSFWYSKAINSNIARWLSSTPYHAEFQIKDGSWNSVYLMDSKSHAVTQITLERERSTACVSHWRLGGTIYTSINHFRKVLNVADLNDIKYLEAAACVTNGNSFHMCDYIFGTAWGLKPEACWDPVYSDWMGLLCYRDSVKNIRERNKRHV